MRTLIALFILASPLAWAEQPTAFANGDAKAGEVLVKAQCVSCHATMFKGDATRMYTRPERKIKSAEQLMSQVRICSANLDKKWVPAEQENAAAYLNREYYHFK